MRVLIPLANGFEEIEAISVIDILRRAQLDVVVAGVESEQITSRGAGTAVDFALQLVAEWVGLAQAETIARGIHSDWTPQLAQV